MSVDERRARKGGGPNWAGAWAVGGHYLVALPQVQLLLFPAGTTPLNEPLAVECRDGRVTCFNGHLPIFTHAPEALAAFRLFTSQFHSRRDGVGRGFCTVPVALESPPPKPPTLRQGLGTPRKPPGRPSPGCGSGRPRLRRPPFHHPPRRAQREPQWSWGVCASGPKARNGGLQGADRRSTGLGDGQFWPPRLHWPWPLPWPWRARWRCCAPWPSPGQTPAFLHAPLPCP